MMNEKSAFLETEKCLLGDTMPSLRLRELAGEWPDTRLFGALLRQQKTGQSPVHHPEGSVWEHTLLVVDEAAALKGCSRDERVFMWAALLHDAGKPSTTRIRKGRITSYDHDRVGAGLVETELAGITGDAAFARKVAMLVRYHMQILYAEKGMPFLDIPGIKRDTDVMDAALLGYCDRLGRTGADRAGVGREVLRFLRKCGIAADRLPWPGGQDNV